MKIRNKKAYNLKEGLRRYHLRTDKQKKISGGKRSGVRGYGAPEPPIPKNGKE